MAAFGALGLNTAQLRRAAALDDAPAPPGALAPQAAWDALWQRAAVEAPRPELPTEAGFAVPFGAFGMLDYLAGSAASVRGGVRAVVDHFATVAVGFRLELDEGQAGAAVVRIVNTSGGSVINDEFTVATLVGRFRHVTRNAFAVQTVFLTRPPAPGLRHADLYRAPVAFSAAHAAVEMTAANLELPLSTADARLHHTLSQLAIQLGLGEGVSELELAVRSRLRDLLLNGRPEAAHVARSLGISERTLHRRLAEAGRRYHEVLDAFRANEAERLLLQGRKSLAEIALALGFSDQTAWNRAFRRWKGMSPTEWLTQRQTELESRPSAHKTSS